MTNDVQITDRPSLPTGYEPRNIGELRQFAQEVTATQLVPTAYRGKPADAMVAMMYGKETANLGPLASLQYIAVINGRPAYYGDALPGIAFNKGLVVDMEELLEGEPGTQGWTAVCTVTRPSGSKVTQRFSVADAKRAGLWDKAGPWKQYPQRMLQWRARSWAIRDAAPHMLFGPTYEELRDAEDYQGPEHAKNVTPGPTAAERRVAMREPDLVEVADQDGEVHLMLPGEVEQFKRENAGAKVIEPEPEPEPAPPTKPKTNGLITVWLGPNAQIQAPSGEALASLAHAIDDVKVYGELNALLENNEKLLARLKGDNKEKMDARIANARQRVDSPDDDPMSGVGDLDGVPGDDEGGEAERQERLGI